MMPTMLLKRMKKNSAAMKGKCFFQVSPRMDLHVIAGELDEVFHAVHEEALRHEALRLLLLEDKHHRRAAQWRRTSEGVFN